MPEQKPGRSAQVVCTPDDFLASFRLRFGEIQWDLAANTDNSVAGKHFLGPGSAFGEDALSVEWLWPQFRGECWINPEFDNIAGFAERSLRFGTDMGGGPRISLLVPLSSSNWARDYCWGKAMVYPLNPRITFKGHRTPYPKDMMLVRYGVGVGCELWKWR